MTDRVERKNEAERKRVSKKDRRDMEKKGKDRCSIRSLQSFGLWCSGACVVNNML